MITNNHVNPSARATSRDLYQYPKSLLFVKKFSYIFFFLKETTVKISLEILNIVLFDQIISNNIPSLCYLSTRGADLGKFVIKVEYFDKLLRYRKTRRKILIGVLKINVFCSRVFVLHIFQGFVKFSRVGEFSLLKFTFAMTTFFCLRDLAMLVCGITCRMIDLEMINQLICTKNLNDRLF